MGRVWGLGGKIRKSRGQTELMSKVKGVRVQKLEDGIRCKEVRRLGGYDAILRM